MRSEHVECEHFGERNSKIHNGILLLAPAYHMNVYINVQMNVHRNVYTNIHKDTSLAATGALAHRLQRRTS